MFHLVKRGLTNAAKETAIGTVTALASTAVALGTYKGGASAIGFFQRQWEDSFSQNAAAEPPMNAAPQANN